MAELGIFVGFSVAMMALSKLFVATKGTEFIRRSTFFATLNTKIFSNSSLGLHLRIENESLQKLDQAKSQQWNDHNQKITGDKNQTPQNLNQEFKDCLSQGAKLDKLQYFN